MRRLLTSVISDTGLLGIRLQLITNPSAADGSKTISLPLRRQNIVIAICVGASCE